MRSRCFRVVGIQKYRKGTYPEQTPKYHGQLNHGSESYANPITGIYLTIPKIIGRGSHLIFEVTIADVEIISHERKAIRKPIGPI